MLALLPLAMTITSPTPITEKTLVVWASPDTLDQRGGSALTIERPGGVFDAVVFGEIAPNRWMAGSDGFSRTQQDQSAYPPETSAGVLTQIAICYADNAVKLYRNGALVSEYPVKGLASFGATSRVLIGLRHTDASPENRFFTGSIEDARIYDRALTPEEFATLKPNDPTGPKPIAWWDFQEGSAKDRMGRFNLTTLHGDARIQDGRLWLDRPGAYLSATSEGSDGTPANPDEANRAFRERLLADPYRPGYHFAIPEGRAMPFDPNGAIFWKGRYHLFYIFQDRRGHNWGHVSSADLVHWRHHPTGLLSGMFSGNCFVNRDGVPTMCYHQVGQGNAMAVALDDNLDEWKKLDSNPITPPTKPGDPFHDRYRSWDPFGWLEGVTYYAVFGGERPGLVKSKALGGPWSYVGDFLANTVPGVSLTEDVSCADFFKLGNKHMLLCISHRLGARYYLGDWRGEQFHPTSHGQMSWVDNSFFAPESLLDDKGRRIMWAWIFDSPQFQTRDDFGWSGTMSLPRVLSLAKDGTLRMDVPKEFERLRINPKDLGSVDVQANGATVLKSVSGSSLELELVVNAHQAQQCGVEVCRSPDGREVTRVFYDVKERRLKIDTTRSSLAEGPRTVESGPFALKANERLRLRVFVDRSVVEVFANGRQAVMRRIYPSLKESVGVRLFASAGPARFESVKAWEMAAANPY